MSAFAAFNTTSLYFCQNTPLRDFITGDAALAYAFPPLNYPKLLVPPITSQSHYGANHEGSQADPLALRPTPAPAQQPPLPVPNGPRGPGLTSPPTPSRSAFPRCAGRSDPAYTSSRRPEARSLCGDPWWGGCKAVGGGGGPMPGPGAAQRDQVEVGGCREPEQTRNSPAAGSSPPTAS